MKELSREQVFATPYGRSVDKVIFEMPDGTKADFFLKREPQVVVVLALTKDQRVILAREYRPGPNAILDELPGGAINEQETPDDAIARELREETGYAGTIKLVTRVWADAYSDQLRYVFVATDCEKVGDQELDEREVIEVVIKSLDEFRAQLRSGELTDVDAGYLGLEFLGLL